MNAMPVPLTAIVAELLALMLVGVSIRVTVLRARTKIEFADGGNQALQRAIRVQGNFIEYVPMALALMAAVEWLGAVLDAIYAVFAEGWSGPAGTEARRRNLATEAIWLGRLTASLLPEEPEALGLLALMLHAEARRAARRDAAGDYVPLAAQAPAAWDAAQIEEAEALLFRASTLGAVGRFQLEAAVQSAHAARRVTGATDWKAIAHLYDHLLALSGSPVVAINRAIAIAEARGAAQGLAALDALAGDARLDEYQPYWAARAGLLARNGEPAAAGLAYERAIGLESDPAVRRFLQWRRAALVTP